MNRNTKACIEDHSPVVAWQKIREGLGISETTAWRWRKRGWVKTMEIGGRRYVSHEELERFKQRAKKGEFSCLRNPPVRGNATK